MSRIFAAIKEIGFGRRNGLIIKIGTAALVAGALAAAIFSASYSDDVNKGLADNLIRLHVVANSDSPEDQALKLDIRDAVLDYMRMELKDSKDIEQTKFIISKNFGKIEEIARNKIAGQGKDYPVKTTMGIYPFPTRSYGDVTLPAGYYQALRIVIGEGGGVNWWCVLFPPLCFVDAAHGTVPDDVKESLKKALSEEEYGIITSADSDRDIPIKIKFKVVEFFQNTRIKFTGLISKIFRPDERFKKGRK